MLLTRDQNGLQGAPVTLEPWRLAAETACHLPMPTAKIGEHFTHQQIKAMAYQWAMANGALELAQGRALAPTLPDCPGSSHNVDKMSSIPHCYLNPIPPSMWSPGTFQMYGVPFAANEVKPGGRFDRAFVPTPDRRMEIELSIVKRSAQAFTDRLRRALAATPYMTATGQSIAGMQKLVPTLRVYFANFALNPIPPTAAELHDSNGWAKWTARGGYPLIMDLIQGKIPLVDGLVGFRVCASMLCNCTAAGPAVAPCTNMTTNAVRNTVSCIQADIGKGGLVTAQDPSTNNGFQVFIAIDQVTNGKFHLALIHKDPSWVTKVGTKLGNMMQSLAAVFCAGQGVAQQQISSLNVEHCVDDKGAKCVKGTPKCTCVAPPNSAGVATGITNYAIKSWCAGWQTDNAAPPQWEPPTIPQPPAAMSMPPWWLIAGAGLAAGAYFFSSRK